MSKADDLLKAFKEHFNEWVCAKHNANSNQSAAIFREVKNEGYKFEEVSPNRWGKMMYCPICKGETTHYKLLSKTPVYETHSRCTITKKDRERVIDLLGKRDAFSGATIASTPEIDHKVPWTRLNGDIDISTLSDSEIEKNFQLLTREHNLLKDRMCDYCKKNGIRPAFMEIDYWYLGDSKYVGSCEGCGWYDGKKWRESLNKKLKNSK